MVPAKKDKIEGKKTTFSTHSNQTDRKPQFLPNASLTQTKIPPLSGHVVANSAATKEQGRKNPINPTMRKKKALNPDSA